METRTYYGNVGRKRIGLLSGILSILIGLFLVWYGIPAGRFGDLREALPILFLFGSLSLLGGFGIYDYMRTVRRTSPTFIVDADGIEITVPLLAKRRIAWSEIETTYIQENTITLIKMRVLCLKVKDPQSVIEMMQTKSQKYVLQSNYNLYGTPAFITDISIDIPIEDLQLEVENRLYERRKAQEANVAERLPDVPDAEPLRVALGNR